MGVDGSSNCVQKAGTTFSSELSMRIDHELHRHVMSICVVSGLRVTTKAELDITPGSASGFNKRILRREDCLHSFTRSSVFSHNGRRLVIVRQVGLSHPI